MHHLAWIKTGVHVEDELEFVQCFSLWTSTDAIPALVSSAGCQTDAITGVHQNMSTFVEGGVGRLKRHICRDRLGLEYLRRVLVLFRGAVVEFF